MEKYSRNGKRDNEKNQKQINSGRKSVTLSREKKLKNGQQYNNTH